MSTALQKVIAGEKPSDGKKAGLLNEAVDKIKNLGSKINRAKEVSESIADGMIATAETQGTIFAASFAEGYFGEEKMDLGPVDLRLGGGLVVAGYGVYQAMNGKSGSHALAIGNGLLASGVGRIGRQAGKALADKKNTPSTPAPAGAAAVPAAKPATAGFPQLASDDIGEIARMVRMTPGTEGESVEGRRRRRRQQQDDDLSGRGRSRFIRARRERDED